MDELDENIILDVDQFILKIGQFGRTQKLLTFLFCLIILPPSYQTLVMMFVGNNPPWRCSAMGMQSGQCNVTNTEFTSDLPEYNDRCSMDRSSWEYNKPKDFSIVTEFDLVCDMAAVALVTNSAVYFGWAIGAVVLGWIADSFGRKTVLFPSVATLLLAAFVSGFSPNIWFFMVMRVIIGFSLGGIIMTLFILAAELVGPKYRSFASTSVWFAFTLALCFVGLQAYFVRNWRLMIKIVSAPYLILLLLWKIIPESVRWLRVNGRLEEAEDILRAAAKRNKVTFPAARLSKSITTKSKATFRDIFMPRAMLISTMVQAFIWFINGMVYYGISLASDNLGGSMYRDFVLTSLTEIPGNLLVIWLCNRYGRKKSVYGSMFITGFAMIGVGIIPARSGNPVNDWARVGLGMVGKLFICTSFNSLYILSVELYPTVVRSQAMGFLLVLSRIGATSAPFIANGLTKFHISAPFYTMGVLTLIAASMCLVLKETNGKPTSETFEDAEEIHAVENNVA